MQGLLPGPLQGTRPQLQQKVCRVPTLRAPSQPALLQKVKYSAVQEMGYSVQVGSKMYPAGKQPLSGHQARTGKFRANPPPHTNTVPQVLHYCRPPAGLDLGQELGNWWLQSRESQPVWRGLVTYWLLHRTHLPPYLQSLLLYKGISCTSAVRNKDVCSILVQQSALKQTMLIKAS